MTLLRYSAVYSRTSRPKFQRCVQSSSSGRHIAIMTGGYYTAAYPRILVSFDSSFIKLCFLNWQIRLENKSINCPLLDLWQSGCIGTRVLKVGTRYRLVAAESYGQFTLLPRGEIAAAARQYTLDRRPGWTNTGMTLATRRDICVPAENRTPAYVVTRKRAQFDKKKLCTSRWLRSRLRNIDLTND
jgi:hypothetical protein